MSQNDFAQAAGHYNTEADGSGLGQAYIYDEGGGVFETFTFPDSGSAQATGINNLRDVCGFIIDGCGKMHGWLQVWGRVTLPEFPGATATRQPFCVGERDITETSGAESLAPRPARGERQRMGESLVPRFDSKPVELPLAAVHNGFSPSGRLWRAKWDFATVVERRRPQEK